MSVALPRCSPAGASALCSPILYDFSFPLPHAGLGCAQLPRSTPSRGGTEHAQLPGYGYGLRKVSAGVRVIHQDLEHGAHIEVTAVNSDPCAPCLWAHGRLQRVDHGQLERRKGIRLWLQACGA